MSDLSAQAAPALKLGREVRKAIRDRNDSILPAVEAYDLAASEDERIEAGANLLMTATMADELYHRRLKRACREAGKAS